MWKLWSVFTVMVFPFSIRRGAPLVVPLKGYSRTAEKDQMVAEICLLGPPVPSAWLVEEMD